MRVISKRMCIKRTPIEQGRCKDNSNAEQYLESIPFSVSEANYTICFCSCYIIFIVTALFHTLTSREQMAWSYHIYCLFALCAASSQSSSIRKMRLRETSFTAILTLSVRNNLSFSPRTVFCPYSKARSNDIGGVK